MKLISFITLTGMISIFMACSEPSANKTTATSEEKTQAGGQESVEDNESMKDIVKIAVASPDHKTLVAALQQAELVTSLANAGPFTVFAPTDAAFGKVDKATLDALMTDEKKSDLQHILEYHVTLSSLKTDFFKDGQTLDMVNGSQVTISIIDGKIMLNNSASIVASVPASNGMVHVIDGVLLPPAK